MWKSRLLTAIDTGALDIPADTVAMDSQCPFGKWLYGEALSPTVRDSEECRRVTELHAQFHRVAAKVVALALSGKKMEADKLMALNGEYTVITTKLVMEMTAWARKIS